MRLSPDELLVAGGLHEHANHMLVVFGHPGLSVQRRRQLDHASSNPRRSATHHRHLSRLSVLRKGSGGVYKRSMGGSSQQFSVRLSRGQAGPRTDPPDARPACRAEVREASHRLPLSGGCRRRRAVGCAQQAAGETARVVHRLHDSRVRDIAQHVERIERPAERLRYPASRLGPSPRTLRPRHPETRPASRSRLDQPTRHFHNRRNESVNRNRRCLKVVDRFRTSGYRRAAAPDRFQVNRRRLSGLNDGLEAGTQSAGEVHGAAWDPCIRSVRDRCCSSRRISLRNSSMRDCAARRSLLWQ